MGQTENNIRAVIVAMRGRVQMAKGDCSPMIRLVDRPFLQHTVECLVERGIKKIDFLLHDFAEDVENHFGSGERWGVEMNFHLVRDPERPFARLKALDRQDSLFLIHADRLQPEAWTKALAQGESQVDVWQNSDDADSSTADTIYHWAGSALLESQFRGSLNFAASPEEFEEQLLDCARSQSCVTEVQKPLSSESFAQLIESQGRVLDKEFPELIRFPGGNDGAWIGRNVYLKTKGTHFEAPFYVGENSTIEGEVSLGPNVVIGEGAMVNPKCEISNALILPNSMVGEGLAINNCVIDRHQLFNVEHDITVSVKDELLFGSAEMSFMGTATLRGVISRVVALVAFCLFLPLIALIAGVRKLIYGRAFEIEEVVKLPFDPTSGSPQTFKRYRFSSRQGVADSNWKHFWLDVLPGLFNILRGDLGWVGVAPLTIDEYSHLPEDLRADYANSAPGLINESTVMYGLGGTIDERLMAEIYYVVSIKSMVSRVKLVASYLVSVVFGPKSKRVTHC